MLQAMLETYTSKAIESLDEAARPIRRRRPPGPRLRSRGRSMTPRRPATGRSRALDERDLQWPDGNVDRYTGFVSYRGTGGFTGMTLALGYLNNGDAVGFVRGTGGGSKRGITHFFPADDFEQTNENVSIIRGRGPKGRSGFAPHEPLLKAYSGFTTDVLRDRKAGKWRVHAEKQPGWPPRPAPASRAQTEASRPLIETPPCRPEREPAPTRRSRSQTVPFASVSGT